MVKEIDLSNVPSSADGKYDWKNSIGKILPFIYEDIEGDILITNYYKSRVILKYGDCHYEIYTCDLINDIFKKIVKPIYFAYKIGDRIYDNKRDLIITNVEVVYKERNKKIKKEKIYTYHCNICGWNNGKATEGTLKQGCGCSCCANHTVVPEINSVAVTHPWAIKYFQNGYDEAINYTYGSEKHLIFQCPNCKNYSSSQSVEKLIKNHGFMCSCRKTISYPEKTMMALLNKLGVNYIYQLTNKTFEWVGKYRYDFYLPDFNMIIETHGGQHYRISKFKNLNLEDVQLNDLKKYNLAKQYVNNYIVIDCKESYLSYIKKSILSNKDFCSILNITESMFNNFNPCESFLDDDYNVVCDLWNNTDKSINEISKIINRDGRVVKELLLLSNINNDTDFHLEDIQKRRTKLVRKRCKPIYCIDLNMYFEHAELCEKLSYDIFNMKMNDEGIRKSIIDNRKYKGYTFKYVTQEEFNTAKEKSPEFVFGDFFILDKDIV